MAVQSTLHPSIAKHGVPMSPLLYGTNLAALPVPIPQVRLIGVEAAGEGVNTNKHAATLTMGTPGVLHGSYSYLLQDDDGQIIDPHSISAG